MLGLEAQKHQVHSTASKSTASTSSVTKPKLNTQTLSDCLQRRVIVWPVESMEYKTRLSRLLDMIVSTGLIVVIENIWNFSLVKFCDISALRKLTFSSTCSFYNFWLSHFHFGNFPKILESFQRKQFGKILKANFEKFF